MNERDLEARLRNTYRAEAERADPGALAERVHSIPATAEPERRRWWHGFGFGATRRSGPGGEQVIGGIHMLNSMRAVAVVAVLALSASVVAVQVGRSPAEPMTSGATEPGDNWVTVTGTQAVQERPGIGSKGVTYSMSDPRLNGDAEVTWEAATESPGVFGNDYALWGTVTITNDGGSWQGQWIGFKDEQGRHHITEWFEGTGDYDGLRYIEQAVEREPAGVLDTTGLIYEGDIPPTVVPPEVVE